MVDPTCADTAKNGAETDVDCGGDTCDPCENDKGCALASDCVSGFCEGATTCAACTETTHCAEVADTYCKDGVCTPTLALGTECAANDSCKSGFCPSSDGLCCDTECANICEGCRAADTGGTDGSCGAITKDSDPADECPSAMEGCAGDTCDGAGACAVKTEGAVCDTTYVCDGMSAACSSSCNDNKDCAPQNYCYGTTCGTAKNCAGVKTLAPNAPSGPYSIDPDGPGGNKPIVVYCDLSQNGVTYETLGIGRHDKAYQGYQILSIKALNLVVIRAAFIWAYNHQGGFINLDIGWIPGNCCFKYSSTSELNFLHFGSTNSQDRVFPCSDQGQALCNVAFNDNVVRFRTGSVICQAPTMAANFFTLHPPVGGPGCSSAENPAIFMKKY